MKHFRQKWENKTFEQIYITHTSIYDKIREFHDPDPKKTRYIKIWGNHDIQWKDNANILRDIFPGIRIYESVLLSPPTSTGGGRVKSSSGTATRQTQNAAAAG